MLKPLSHQVVILLFAAGLWLTPWSSGIAQEPLPEQPAVSPEEVEALIQDLEDPATRERLIQQLKALAEVEAAEPPSEVQNATLELLQAVSQRLENLRETVLQLVDSVAELTWVQAQVSDPTAQQFWIEVLITLTLVLGLGNLAFYGMRWLLARPYRALTQRPPGN